MEILEVKDLCKNYPGFTLDHVSFSLKPGYIMGFIGKNGAGKTTTIKSIYQLIHFDAGEINVFGKKLSDYNETELKQDISLMLGGMDIYPNFRLREITIAIKDFYRHFDETRYQSLLHKFSLDPEKRFKELSNGMKTKYLLTLAMSHNAKLLLLDEPTSGLDPFSRDEILTEFQEFIKDGEHSILFSTQIISDLEAIADYITYIKDGKIVKSEEKEKFIDDYRLIKYTKEEEASIPEEYLIGRRKSPVCIEALIRKENLAKIPSTIMVLEANIETIMIFTERGLAL